MSAKVVYHRPRNNLLRIHLTQELKMLTCQPWQTIHKKLTTSGMGIVLRVTCHLSNRFSRRLGKEQGYSTNCNELLPQRLERIPQAGIEIDNQLQITSASPTFKVDKLHIHHHTAKQQARLTAPTHLHLTMPSLPFHAWRRIKPQIFPLWIVFSRWMKIV